MMLAARWWTHSMSHLINCSSSSVIHTNRQSMLSSNHSGISMMNQERERVRKRGELDKWRKRVTVIVFIDADVFAVRKINLHSHIFRLVRYILSNMEQALVDMGKSWSNTWSCNRRWPILMFVRTSCTLERKAYKLHCSLCQHSPANLVSGWTGETDDEPGRALQADREDRSIDS
jgi:hypothetical protein